MFCGLLEKDLFFRGKCVLRLGIVARFKGNSKKKDIYDDIFIQFLFFFHYLYYDVRYYFIHYILILNVVVVSIDT